jgi:tetratricopeptide (TPR) repeat protein
MNRQQRRAETKEASAKSKMPIRAGSAVHTLFDSATSHHHAGRLADAERLYSLILTKDPQHADSIHLLGVIAFQTGRPGIAAEKISAAIRINGSIASYHSNLGSALRDLGRFDEAAEACREAIQLMPRFSEAHANLGAALYELGRFDEAVGACQNAIRYNPNLPSAYTNLGNALAAQARHEEAVTAYTSAIRMNQNQPEAHSNLGAVLDKLERFAEAIAAYDTAIRLKPDDALAHSNRGNALRQQDRFDEAIASCNTAIGLRPNYAEAHSNLGNALKGVGRFEEALTAYRTAISLKPDYTEAHSNLGALLHSLGRFDEALVACNAAIRIKPEHAKAHLVLGNALKGLGRLDEAFTACRKAIDLVPDDAEVHTNLGALLEILGRFDEAVTSCNTAIRIQPDYALAHSNLGVVLEHLCRFDEALAAYDRAIALEPENAEFHHNFSLALLKTGSFRKGWNEYEWRWKSKQMSKSQRHFAQPIWHGDIDAGKTLLIHAEQGFGDTLQFCRYATLAAEHGMRVIVEAPKPLVRLLGSLPGVDQVIDQGDALPRFDVHAPMMSLPRLLETTIATIPGRTPYLRADEDAIAAWQQRLSAIAGQNPRIGLVWAGNARTHFPELPAIDQRRSIAPEFLAPLFKIRGLKFFSLQKDGPAAPAEFPLIDLMQEMEDFADTAALIANLDLVISVDTAVAHLAAAIGKPVWLLNRFDSCWRWLSGRRDSPWYPELRLYNQPQPGDWQPVVAEIAADLIQFQSEICRMG